MGKRGPKPGTRRPGSLTPKERMARNDAIKQRRRLQAIEVLGGGCKRCGEADSDVLQIDHVSPLMRRTSANRQSNWATYMDVLERGDDGTYQVLCLNCHCIKSHEDLTAGLYKAGNGHDEAPMATDLFDAL